MKRYGIDLFDTIVEDNKGPLVYWDDVKELKTGFCDDCGRNVITEPYNKEKGVYVCFECGQFTKAF